MQKKKDGKYKGSFLLRLAVVCLALFVAFTLVSRQVEIAEKRRELEALKAELQQQNILNDELSGSLKDSSGLEEYAEKKARRDLNYAKPGERIFVDVGGGE